MNLTKEAQEGVLRTCNRDYHAITGNFRENIDFVHGAIGLMTEYHEFIEAKKKKTSEYEETGNKDVVHVVEELADMLWYIELIKVTWGIDYNSVQLGLFTRTDGITTQRAGIIGSEILDFAKRCTFYGQLHNTDEKSKIRLQEFHHNVKDFSRWLTIQATEWGTTYTDLAIIVIEKLSERYGDKFSDKDALIRNLKAERENLEKNIG